MGVSRRTDISNHVEADRDEVCLCTSKDVGDLGRGRLSSSKLSISTRARKTKGALNEYDEGLPWLLLG